MSAITIFATVAGVATNLASNKFTQQVLIEVAPKLMANTDLVTTVGSKAISLAVGSAVGASICNNITAVAEAVDAFKSNSKKENDIPKKKAKKQTKEEEVVEITEPEVVIIEDDELLDEMADELKAKMVEFYQNN